MDRALCLHASGRYEAAADFVAVGRMRRDARALTSRPSIFRVSIAFRRRAACAPQLSANRVSPAKSARKEQTVASLSVERCVFALYATLALVRDGG